MARRTTNDTRKVLGSLVKDKDIHVTTGIACPRCYGAQVERSMLPGTVVEVLYHQNATTTRTTTSITIELNVGKTVSREGH